MSRTHRHNAFFSVFNNNNNNNNNITTKDLLQQLAMSESKHVAIQIRTQFFQILFVKCYTHHEHQ